MKVVNPSPVEEEGEEDGFIPLSEEEVYPSRGEGRGKKGGKR